MVVVLIESGEWEGGLVMVVAEGHGEKGGRGGEFSRIYARFHSAAK